MLKKDGSLFHIDFGFIFDKEPNFKGWAPKIKINRDMYELIEKEKRSEEFLKECTVMFEGIRCNYRFFIALTVLWNDSHLECVSDSFMHLRNMFNKFVMSKHRNDALEQVRNEIKNHIGCLSGYMLDNMRMMKE